MRAGHAEEIRLKRLKKDEVQQLLIQMAGHEVSTTFTEEIYKHTEGNPFFIGESIRALIEEGKLTKVGERWQRTVALEELVLPQSVRLLIERRLAHLSPECRVTLAYAAALGRQFNSTLLCQARNLSDDTIAEHIDDAIRTQILMVLDGNPHEVDNEYEDSQDADLIFTHDKICEVLALWLNPLRRRTAHRQIAQAIETRYRSRLETFYSKLAYHHQMAEETAKAVGYLLNAADKATSVYAFVEAASLMEKAVELLLGEENRPQCAELLRKLSVDVYLYIGKPDKAISSGIAACTLWQELTDPVKEAVRIAHETLEKAQRHNAVGAQGWANLVLSFVSVQQGQWDDAEHFADEAAAIAEMMSETDLLARVFWGRSNCAGWQGDWERAVEHSLEALRISQRDGEVSLVYPYLLFQAAKACFHAEKTESAQHYLDQAMQFAQKNQYQQVSAIGHRLQGRILQAQEKFDLAYDHFEQSLAELAALSDTVEYARTQQAYGLFFRDRNYTGDQERSIALLQQADVTFKKLGVNG